MTLRLRHVLQPRERPGTPTMIAAEGCYAIESKAGTVEGSEKGIKMRVECIKSV